MIKDVRSINISIKAGESFLDLFGQVACVMLLG